MGKPEKVIDAALQRIGCSFTHAIVSGPETQDTSPNENIEIIAWNNEIRSN